MGGGGGSDVSGLFRPCPVSASLSVSTCKEVGGVDPRGTLLEPVPPLVENAVGSVAFCGLGVLFTEGDASRRILDVA